MLVADRGHKMKDITRQFFSAILYKGRKNENIVDLRADFNMAGRPKATVLGNKYIVTLSQYLQQMLTRGDNLECHYVIITS